jgi:hypothetical protein
MMPTMPTRDGERGDDRFERLAAIDRLLEEYRATRDRRLLRQAIELWDEVEADRLLTTGRSQIH